MRLLPGIIARMLILSAGLGVLGISLARASLVIQAQDLNENNIWSREMVFSINYGDGVTETANYSLPEVGILPVSPFYGLKRVRDYFWIMFSRGLDKPRLVLLVADKKIEEAQELLAINKNSAALLAGNEGLDHLEYASQLLSQIKGNEDQVKQLSKQVYLAGFAYKEVISKGENAFDMDKAELYELIQRYEKWNEKQKNYRGVWDN